MHKTKVRAELIIFSPFRLMVWINSFSYFTLKNSNSYNLFLDLAGQETDGARKKRSPLADCTYLMEMNTVPCIPAGPKSCLVRNTAWSWCSACSGSERCCE